MADNPERAAREAWTYAGGIQKGTPVSTATTPNLANNDLGERMAEIEKGQQLAEHFPNGEALDRARRILTGEITPDEAFAELDRKYGAA